MKNNKKYVNAIQFLEDTEFDFANGPSNGGAIDFIEDVEGLGCKCFCVPDKNKEYFGAELFIKLPEVISTDLLVLICCMKPDEISEEDDGLLRLWWD